MSAWSAARWHDARVNLAAHPVAWPFARVVRRLGPVVRVPGLGHVVNDATVAHELLVRDADFVKSGNGSVAHAMTEAFGPSALANMDGEAHRALRTRLGPLASPAVAEQWFAASRAPLDAAVQRLLAGEAVDLAQAARLLAGRLTLTLLGLEADDALALEVHALGERISGSLRLSAVGGMRTRRADADLARLAELAHAAFRRDDLPPDALVARLRRAQCTEEETRGVLSIFFVAGALTLGVALPRLVGLLADSGRLHAAAADERALARAVEEGMRFTSPVPATLRFAARDAEVAGHRFAVGERILILTANLARDPALFPDPDRFDADRAPNPKARYLWYGAGPHFCIGFPLAQRVLHHAVAQVAAVPPTVRVVRRRAARGVLLPAWESLVLRRSP